MNDLIKTFKIVFNDTRKPDSQVAVYANFPDFNLFATKEWIQEEDYTINGEITYTQRPNIDGSKAATLADLSTRILPSISDVNGLVTIKNPSGSSGKLLFNNTFNNMSVEINSLNTSLFLNNSGLYFYNPS